MYEARAVRDRSAEQQQRSRVQEVGRCSPLATTMATAATAAATRLPAGAGDTQITNQPPDSLQHIFTPGDRAPSLPWPDIGNMAKWSVSSFKFGFGPECLRDDDPETFWQSVLSRFSS